MSRRLQWTLIALALLIAALAWWLDQRHPFPPLMRNTGMRAQAIR